MSYLKSVDELVKKKADKLAWDRVVKFYTAINDAAEQFLNNDWGERQIALKEIAEDMRQNFLEQYGLTRYKFVPPTLLAECLENIIKQVVEKPEDRV